MKTNLSVSLRNFFRLCLPLIVGIFLGAAPARAGLQIDMHLYGAYYCFPWISTNSTTPSPTNTAYFVWSPTSTINSGIHFQLKPDNSIDGGSSWFDYPSFIHEITNGNWTLLVTNNLSTNQYTFKVTVPPTITSDLFASVNITSPTDGQVNVANTPTFTWTGPAGWAGSLDVWDDSVDNNNNHSRVTDASLTPNQTSWPSPVTLPDGTNSFSAKYTSNATAFVTVSTPVDSLSHPFPGFSYVSTLETSAGVNFYVGAPVSPLTFVHKNIAHYTFDDSGSLGQDSSGNGNDMSGPAVWGPTYEFDTDAEAGGGATKFFGTSCMTAADQTLTNLNAVLAGSFTFSAWVKTTVTTGEDYNNAFYGAAIFWAYNDQEGNTNDTIPLSITGSKAAFSTRGENPGAFDNLHSTTSVNDGYYHLITVTRDQTTGEKKMYVDGNFEASETGTINPLNGNNYRLTIGGWAYCTDGNCTNFYAYNGLLDDVQIYSGVLSDTEVASLYANPGTTIPDISGSANGIVVHYDFDEGTELAADVSGNGNNIVHAGSLWWGSGPSINSLDTAAGAGAVYFDGGSYLTASSNILTTLAGEFSVSLWLETSQTFGDPGDPAWAGAGVIASDSPNAGAKDLIPVALTGGQVAFNIGDGVNDNTLNSSATVNDGIWHHVVVTRNLTTGGRQIFIDGTLDSSDTAATVLLDSPVLLTIGAKSDASDSDPASPDWNGSNGYEGLVDDIQVYNWVLSASEVAELFANPGATVTPTVADFNSALGTSGWTWTTSGDTSWFVQTTNTYNGSPDAAQSGSVVDFEASTLTATVTGPGTLTFYWASQDDCNGFDYEFRIDGDYQTDIGCSTPWTQAGPFLISAGQHVLTWTVSANGDMDTTAAGFLDQVVLSPIEAPVITLNPFSQTNHPGYSVALRAAASGNPAPTWQWFKVGNASPIADATNALYIPTNSGTAGVAGSYYAVASNLADSANSTTATVSFASAPLPPEWSAAFKSPFYNNNLPSNEGYISCFQDSSSNLYAVGFLFGTNSIGSTNYISPNGTYSADIVKQTPAGNAIWATGVTNNGNGNAQAYCVVAAPGNGIYVAGNFNGTNWLGTNQLTDLSEGSHKGSIFLARLDANGNPLWVRTVSGTNFCFTLYYQLVSDSAGNVTLSGLFSGSTIFSSTNVATSTNLFAPGQSGGLAQYDPNGTLRWAEITTNWIIKMTRNSGRIYGTFGNNSTDFYFGGVHVITDRAKCVVALNEADGQPLWVRGVGAPVGLDNPFNVVYDDAAVAVSGTNVFIVGTAIASNAAFGPYSVSWPDYARQYLARCDTNGTPQFITSFGSATTMPWSILPASSGGVYVSGDFETYSVFGNDIIAGQHLTSIGTGYFSDAFLAKFDANGNPLWARAAIPQENLVALRGLTAASDGVWACGLVQSPTSFGSILVGSSVTCIGFPLCTLVYSESGVLAKINDSSIITPQAVTLLNPQDNGTTFQIQFASQSGFAHAVQFRTNLVSGLNWQTYSNVTGDGALKTISIPLSIFSPAQQGFIRVSTQ